MSTAQRDHPLCVLEVDDDRDTADSCGALLSLWGHRSLVAYDAETALATARREKPHVVLLDLGLPHTSGLELARQLRAEPGLGGLLLIAVTGYGREDDRRESEAAGFDHHLLKPVEPELLRRMLVEHTARRLQAN
jgi:CheY-like chemotaxis protein